MRLRLILRQVEEHKVMDDFSIPFQYIVSLSCRYTVCSDRSFIVCECVYACVHVSVREDGLAREER